MGPRSLALGLLTLTACSVPFMRSMNDPEPTFEPRASVPVVTYLRATGAVSPEYFHEDRLVIFGNGDWVARRSYPYTSPPRQQGLGAGAIRLEALQEIVDEAFAGSPRFVDTSSSSMPLPGAGTTTVELVLKTATRSVSVLGPVPPSVQRVIAAIETRTMPLDLMSEPR